MKKNSSHCDPGYAKKFLDQQLNQKENLLFEDHLESCAQCRHQLEEVAANGDVWMEVRESLESGQFETETMGLDTKPEFSHESIMRSVSYTHLTLPTICSV